MPGTNFQAGLSRPPRLWTTCPIHTGYIRGRGNIQDTQGWKALSRGCRDLFINREAHENGEKGVGGYMGMIRMIIAGMFAIAGLHFSARAEDSAWVQIFNGKDIN